MADSRPERGMKFAKQQLLRHGWTEGKGLGRDENGISEAIKVKVKCNKEGIGHKKAEEFTFHWWDHVFNKASSSLQVESDQNGVEVKTTVDLEGAVSNKKPRRAALCKDKMYGRFVKAGTLLSGEVQPEPQSSDSSSSSEDDDRMDLSSTTRLSDADLMKACGGRTAHKGARHGFNMSAKLARLEQQEAEFMAKYGKKNQLSNNQPKNSPPVDQSVARCQEEMSEVPQKEKKKEKKEKRADQEEEEFTPQKERKRGEEHEEEEEEGVMEVAVATVEGSLEKQPSKQNKIKSCREEKKTEEDCPPQPKQKKKKKEKKKKRKEEETNMEEEKSVEEDQNQEEAQATAPPKRSKKKEIKIDEDQNQEEAQATAPPKRSKKKEIKIDEDQNQEEVQDAAPSKRSKKKKKEIKMEEDQNQEEVQDAAPPKRSKKKKEIKIDEDQNQEVQDAAPSKRSKKKEEIQMEEDQNQEVQDAAPPKRRRRKESRE
ncbi:hypothetical protein NHX12_001677 [Muraenolepis orangiensis]|uniref:G patch domain-containing protein 4 n=1 Tax=Muraenolepis orangiensis TaxID=630683 RepID=A0A9Q0IGS0_9TELE|nr:hypothetical protein NHX12_001677 [Muraenolepis orangiensis]